MASLKFFLAALSLACVGMIGVDSLGPNCADCEFYYVEIFYPTQGVPLYSKPSFDAAGQLIYSYAPKIYPIHSFQIVGHARIAAIVKVLKPGIMQTLVVHVTNLGLEITAEALYSLEAFALFAGSPPPLAAPPMRILPCPRVYLLEVTISPSGNSSAYRQLLGEFTTELLNMRQAGIILDLYKYLGTVPTTFVILGCGTPTFFDQLTLSFASVADDYGVIEVGRTTALTKWNPMISGQSGGCFYRSTLFPTGKK